MKNNVDEMFLDAVLNFMQLGKNDQKRLATTEEVAYSSLQCNLAYVITYCFACASMYT